MDNVRLNQFGTLKPDAVRQKYQTGEYTLDDVKAYNLYHHVQNKDMTELAPDQVKAGYDYGMFSIDDVRDYHDYHTAPKTEEGEIWTWKDLARAPVYAVRDFVQETKNFADAVITEFDSFTEPFTSAITPDFIEMSPEEKNKARKMFTLPDEVLGVDRPHSLVGRIVEEFGQEALGMVLPMGVLNKMTKVGKFSAFAAKHKTLARLIITNIAGAWAAGTARNPYDPTFVDILDQWIDPEQPWSGPVATFLKSDKDRPELELRAVHAIQESFMGTITDFGISMIRKSLRLTKKTLFARAGGHTDEVAREVDNVPKQMEFDFKKPVDEPTVKPAKAPKPDAGDAKKAKPQVGPEKEAVEARVSLSSKQLAKMGQKILNAAKGIDDIEPSHVLNHEKIDWDTITHPDNMENLLNSLEDVAKRKLERIKGGSRVTHAETLTKAKKQIGELAEVLGVDPDDHWNYWNNRAAHLREKYADMATEVQKHRDMLVSYADYVQQLAEKASKEDPSSIVYAYTHMRRLYEMMGSMRGISAEIGRGLNIHKALSRSLGTDPTVFARFAKEAPVETIADMTNAVKGFTKQPSIINKASYVRNTMRFSYGKAFLSYRQAQLVFSPLTLARNLVSNTAALSWETVARTLAAPGLMVKDALTGKGINLHHMKAAGQFYQGLFGGLVDAVRIPVRNWGKVFKNLRDGDLSEFGTAFEAFKTGRPQTDMFGKINTIDDFEELMSKIPILGKPVYEILSSSFKALAATDEIFASMAYSAEKRHLSYLRSFDEATSLIKAGKHSPMEFDRLFNQKLTRRLAEPDKDIMDRAIMLKRDITFTEDLGKWSTDFFRLLSPRFDGGWVGRNAPPVIRAFTMPFINVAVNMWKWSARLIPGIGAITPRALADFRAGGIRAASRIASQIMSIGLGAGVTSLVMNDLITGKLPDGYRSAELQEYSINASVFGGSDKKWISYREFPPFSTMVGLLVDSINWARAAQAEKPMRIEDEPTPGEDIAIGVLTILSDNFLQGSFVTGLRDWVELLTDPERHQTSAKKFLVRQAATLSPFAMALQFMQREMDPYYRDITKWSDAIALNNPWTDDLLPLRDPITGNNIERKNTAGFLLMTSEQTTEPGLKALFESGAVVKKMGKTLSLGNVTAELSDDQYQELHDILAEQDVLKDLNKEARSYGFRNSDSDYYNAKRLKKVITKHRSKAKKEFLRRHPDIKTSIKDVRRAEKDARHGRGKSENSDIKPFKDLIKE